MYVPDNYDQWLIYETEQQKERERQATEFPRCDCCEKPIDDYYWNINGEIFCENCLNENFRMAVEVW